MKKYLLLIPLIFSIFFYSNSFAQESCSKVDYTVLTINGIFTNNKAAVTNRDKLKEKLYTYNGEQINVDFLHNESHLGGMKDLLDVVDQGLFKQQNDYDLTEILNDASEKIKTQKVLLVGHSQGNFYANNFYKKVADIEGGIPKESIGVYSVATPANEVAGDGDYITSEGDRVIRSANVISKALPPNTRIEYKKGGDILGHDFSKVYLEYRSNEIISGIKSSLGKLKNNDIQTSSQCISPQKISIGHKIKKIALVSVDYIIGKEIGVIKNNIDTGIKIAKTIGNTFTNLGMKTLAMVGIGNEEIPTETPPVEEPEILNEKTEQTPVTTNTEQSIQPTTEIKTQEINPEPQVQPIPESTPVIRGGGVISHEETPTPDTVAPVITLNGESEMTVFKGAEFTDPGATAVDEVDGSITVSVTGSVDTTTIGTYTLTYTAVDKALNTGTLTRTVIVSEAPEEPDTTAPVITLNGDEIISIYINDSYEDQGATAVDERDGTVEVTKDGTVDNTAIGVYEITYTAKDKAENTATKTRIINVVALPPDVDGPVITLNGDEILGIKLNDTYTELGATAMDKEDGEVSVEIFGNVDTTKKGEYVITYTAKDSADNISTKTRKVKVSTYVYIDKYTFGTGNGDGRNWQVWSYTGSNIYNWTNTYVNNYLNQKFKIKTQYNLTCSGCLEMGIFKNGDPRKGFELTDLVEDGLSINPQSNKDEIEYEMEVQWDATGYTVIVYKQGEFYKAQRGNIENVDSNIWVGWGTGINRFKIFPSGTWVDSIYKPPFAGATGGSNMVLTPIPAYDPNSNSSQNLSSEKSITSFKLKGLNPEVVGVINEENHTINITAPYGSDLAEVAPTIEVSDKANIYPFSGAVRSLDGGPYSYTVVAEDHTSTVYRVTGAYETNPNPVLPLPPVNDPPTITSYTLNGLQDNITINPLVNNLTLVLNANKNVTWVSVKIERVVDYHFYKMYYASNSCANGTPVCTKIWDGILSKGGLLKDGDYKIRVRIRDELSREYEQYLPSIITVKQ